MYTATSARTIQVGFLSESLKNFIDKHLVSKAKICTHFQVSQQILELGDQTCIANYNLVFYQTTIDEIRSTSDKYGAIMDQLQVLGQQLRHPHSHLFVVVDECELEVNSDDDLVCVDEGDQAAFQQFDQALDSFLAEELYDCFKINLKHADIWKTILDESSIATLTDDQIEELVPQLAKKHRKGSIQDKKKAIRAALKKTDTDDMLAATGFTEFIDITAQYLRLLQQKKTVVQNYLHNIRGLRLDFSPEPLNSLNLILDEITAISYLKPDMRADLYKQAQGIANDKVKSWIQAYTNTVAVDTTKSRSNSIYIYRDLLEIADKLIDQHALTDSRKILERETKTVSQSIATHHRKELEAVSDLNMIATKLETIAEKDKHNLGEAFDQIFKNHKIMLDNVEKSDKWIAFVNRALELDIDTARLQFLIERIIFAKIEYCSDSRRIDIKNPLAVYPSALQVFLLTRLNNHFLFKRLYMYLTYTIRYSGRNITEQIIGLEQEQFDDLLKLEYKLDALI